jgi:hypothetical protein
MAMHGIRFGSALVQTDTGLLTSGHGGRDLLRDHGDETSRVQDAAQPVPEAVMVWR